MDGADPKPQAIASGSGGDPGGVLEQIVARARDGQGRRASSAADLSLEVEDLRARLAEMQEELARIASEAQQLERVAETFGAVIAASAEERHGDAYIAFVRASRLRRDVVDRDPSLGAGLEATERALRSAASRVAPDLSRTLGPALAERGIKLDSHSRYPSFFVRDGYFEIKVAADKGEAVLRSRGGSKERVSVDPGGLADAVATLHARVFDREIDRAAVLAELTAAYGLVRSQNTAEAIPIGEVFDAMKAADKTYTMDRFLVDLEAVAFGGSALDASEVVIKFDTTRDTKLGVLLPGHEDKGYKGYLKLVVREGNDGDEGSQRS